MPRVKFQTLTEQMFYILLCLKHELSGIEIQQRIRHITKGRVNVGAGTLYNLLEQFCESELIRETKFEGRKRCYMLTEKGKLRLDEEYQRLFAQAVDYQIVFGGKL